MKRSLKDIEPVVTSLKAGMKRVLLAASESGCAITQMAITDLKAGKVAEAHVHIGQFKGFKSLRRLRVREYLRNNCLFFKERIFIS